GSGGSEGHSETRGASQALLAQYEEFTQLASRTYWTFDEKKHEWGRTLRRLHRGQGVLQIADDDNLYEIDIKRTAPAHLALEWERVLKSMPAVAEAYERLLENNFRQDCFVSPAQIERERQV